MSMKSTTRKRIAILLAMVVLGTGALGGVYVWRQHVKAARTAAIRAEGFAAFDKGDYPTALEKLALIVNWVPHDVELTYRTAKARAIVPSPDGRHVLSAISLYRRVLEESPDYPQARQELLDLYVVSGFNAETISTADMILRQDPNNSGALRAKSVALFRARQFEPSLTTALRLVRTDPLDLDAQILVLQILSRKDGGPQLLKERTDALLKEHPNDSRFELLKSEALRFTNSPEAADWARKAAARPNLSPELLARLVAQFDALRLFAEGTALLDKYAAQVSSAVVESTSKVGATDMRVMWLARLLQAQRPQDAVDATAKLDLRTASVDQVAMRALAFAQLKQPGQVNVVQQALAERGRDDRRAAAWAGVLRELACQGKDDSESWDLKAALAACQEAYSRIPANPFITLYLGQVYLRRGDQDLARTNIERAARIAPAWPAPLIELSAIYQSNGRPAEAVAVAQEAALRAPGNREVLVTLASALSFSTTFRPDFLPDLQKVLAEIHQRYPDETRTLPLEAYALLRAKKPDDAAKMIQGALGQPKPLSESLLIRLSQVSMAGDLGLEKACFDASEKAHGFTPDLAFAKAQWLINTKEPGQAVKLLDDACAKHPHEMPWRVARARVLDQINDARAQVEWVALGDEFPDSVPVQWAALNAKAAHKDHAFTGRTLQRLTDQLGTQGATLQFARARWLLEGQPSEKDSLEAAQILADVSHARPDLAAPRLLLASCLERSGNITGAADQLEAVASAQPDNNPVALELARVLHRQGNFARARPYIDRVAASTRATADDRRRAAALYSQQGDFAAALKQMEAALALEPGKGRNLSMAALYLKQNQVDTAESICKELMQNAETILKNPAAKPEEAARSSGMVETIQFYADLLASHGRKPEAEQILAKLDTLKLQQPGLRELIRAEYFQRHGTPEQALAEYQAAVKAAPKVPAVWRQLITHHLTREQLAPALACAAEAAQAIPDNASFQAMHANAKLLTTVYTNVPAARPLLIALVQDPAAKDPVLEAMQILADAQTTTTPSTPTLVKLRQLADRNQQLFALQAMVIQFYVMTNQLPQASELATRAVQAFPASAEPAELAVNTLALAGRWDQVIQVAETWQKRETGDSMAPQLVIAGARLQLGAATDAVHQLQPYITNALTDPEKNAGVIMVYTQALIAANQIDEAAKLLRPLLPKAPRWRNAWVGLAAQTIREPKTASAWLNEVAAQIPENNIAEQASLGEAWMTLGQRQGLPRTIDTGVALLTKLAAKPDAPAKVYVLLGVNYEVNGKMSEAEASYRQALQHDPKQHVALNNLAMAIVNRNGDLNEALALATRAVETAKFPPYYDTRATILLRLKRYDDALASIAEAVRLDPRNPEWRIAQTAIYLEAGRKDKAMQSLFDTEALQPAKDRMAPAVWDRYAQLRKALGKI